MEYEPYKEYELHDMFKEPRRVSSDPYKLFAAYMISCLYELYEPDDDSETYDPENIWGWLVDKQMCDKNVKEAIEDFTYACYNDLSIAIWSRGYSIRKARLLDKGRLESIFQFPVVKTDEGDCYKVVRNGIMNLEKPVSDDNSPISEYHRNKAYLEEVIRIAKDDKNDGYDKLTDMEVTMYCWYVFYKKIDSRDYWIFRKTYEKFLYTDEDDDRACWTDKVLKTKRLDTQYLFSANKVKDWNKRHKQKSIIDV